MREAEWSFPSSTSCLLPNDVTLPAGRGIPLQLVTRSRFGNKCAKWITSIQVVDQEKRRYWESRGYSNSTKVSELALGRLYNFIDMVGKILKTAGPLTDMEYAECFNAFKKVSTEWMAIEEWLSDDFIPSLAGRKSAKILSIGSGTGDFDLILMRMLLGKIPTLSYIALDPNEEHNKIFLNHYRESGLNLTSFQIIAKPFCEDFLGGGFDLVHLTHCLYYIPDRKMAIRKAYDMLNPGGILLIFHQTPLGINEIQRIYLKQVKGDDKELFSSHDILLIMKELSLRSNFDILISDIDVTDCIAGTDTGRRILSFFLESNLDGLDQRQYNEIIQTLKEICWCKDRRYFLFHPSGIFWIRKPL